MSATLGDISTIVDDLSARFTTTDPGVLDTVAADKTHRAHAVIENLHADLKNSALATGMETTVRQRLRTTLGHHDLTTQPAPARPRNLHVEYPDSEVGRSPTPTSETLPWPARSATVSGGGVADGLILTATPRRP